MSVGLRNMGTTATFAPLLKRGSARLSTGQAVFVVPDANLATANGGDTTGVAKLAVYVSTDANRTAYTTHQTYTPAVAIASSTRAAVVSCTVRENDSLYVVYQGTDNSLRLITFVFTAGAYGAGSEQTIVSAGAITNRFRAVDIDALPTNSSLVVAAYEANAATGQGAHARVYVRLTDNTTWVRAYTTTFFTTEFIKAGSEDISVAWNKAGATANVAQFVVYFTKTHTTDDAGDTLRELSFNVASGTTDSATTVGTWYTNLYNHQAAGARRGFLFSEANDHWMFAASVGTRVTLFAATRLTHNVFTGLVTNQTTSNIIATFRDQYFEIVRTLNVATPISAEFCDNNLVFAYASLGVTSSNISRFVVMKFSPTVTVTSAIRVDNVSRIADANYTLHDGVIGVYGGGNKNLTSSLYTYNFGVMYGRGGNVVSTTAGVDNRIWRALIEDVISAPRIVSPLSTVVTTDMPTIRIEAQNSNLYTSVLGKIQFQLASDSGFTTNLQTITETDDQFNTFSVTGGTVPPTRNVSYTLTQAQALFTGTWYARARVLDDLGGMSSYSPTISFTISHPPVASPTGPNNGTSKTYGTGDVVFGWTFSDPEPTDVQSAYQVVVIRNDTGAVVSDTGKVTSSLKAVTINIAAGLKDVPLQWSVRLWDSDNTAGVYSTANVFTLVDPPTVVVTGPTEGGTINTALPVVTWTFTVGGTRTQRAYRVRIWDLDASPDEEVADTGWVFSNAVTHSFTEQILFEGVNYRADVYVQDNLGLTDDDSNSFITDWLPPVGVSLTVVADEFKATLTWTNAANDVDWVGYRVYRRYMKVDIPELDINNTANTWEVLAEITSVASSYTYYDYTMPLNKSVDYIVVQVADRFGSLLESDIGAIDTVTSPGDRYYFVPEVPVGAIASFEASYVTGDSFVREIEQNALHVRGRGRQVQVGDDLGYSGTLTLHLRNPSTARSDREFLEYLSGPDAGNVYIRSPFGDVLYVSIGNIGTTRIAGMGNSDLVDLTVPYVVVFSEAPLTRVS